jgi:hypothetical protein
MSIIDFPLSPAINDTYSFGDYSWIWDGNGWKSNVNSANTGPTGPTGSTGVVTATDPLFYNASTKNVILKIQSGGGLIGDNAGLRIDTSIVPSLTSSNTFAGDVTVTGKLTASNFDFTITPIDDPSSFFTAGANRFLPRYQGAALSITNPFRLLIALDGIIQSVSFPDYVWNSPLKKSGFWVDSKGYIAFYSPVSKSATFDGRIMAGEVKNSTTKIYPFRPMDIILGD